MRAVLIAGGNQGDVKAALDRAQEEVAAHAGTLEAVSGDYWSQAWGFEASERFLNRVWVVETPLEPEALLDRLEEIERGLGRGPQTKGGAYRSRTMDIDILFYGEEVIDTPRLKIPHPLLHLREFVLQPLCEVAPEMVHPVLGKKIKDL